MLKSNSTHRLRSLLVPSSVPLYCRLEPYEQLLFSISSSYPSSQNRAHTSASNLTPNNPILADYLINTLSFSKTEALVVSKRFSFRASTEKPKVAISYLKSLGLSNTQLQSAIKCHPQLLFADVEKTLKPKIALLCQELGLQGSNLGILISKNSALLASSLEKRVKPGIGFLRKYLELYGSTQDKESVNDLIFRILSRFSWVIGSDSNLESNIKFLKSCGVVDSQIIMLLKTNLRPLSWRHEELKNLVSRAVEMGFEKGSRMLVYGVSTISRNSAEAINRKFELFREFGFSMDECDLIFMKFPTLFKLSEAKLRRGIEFFTKTLTFDKSVLVGSPILLRFSMEKRMIPRFEVMKMVKSRGLLENEPSFITVLLMTDKEFVEKFISRFGDDGKEMQVAFDNLLLGTSDTLAWNPMNLTSDNSILADYLINTLSFSKTEAHRISKRFSFTKSTEKPKAVISYLKSLGLSNTQLQSAIKRQPQVLFADVEKTIMPKIAFYQELGMHGPRLGILISKNSALLTSSLENRIKPSIGVLRKYLELYGSKGDKENVNYLIFRVLSRFSWIIASDSKLESNIRFLQSCGVVDSQMITLLKEKFRLFNMRHEEFKNLVSRAVEMGFEKGSGMLVYGVLALSCNSAEAINRKFQLFTEFGFSRDECDLMFMKCPLLFRKSEARLRRGIEFFTKTLTFDKLVLVRSPFHLTFSVEKRMIPRFEVMKMVKSRGLLEKEPSSITVLQMTDKKFVKDFISRFGDDGKEMQVAYDNLLLGSSEF